MSSLDKKRSNWFNFQERRLRLDIRKNTLIERTAKHCNSLPVDAIECPLLKVFQEVICCMNDTSILPPVPCAKTRIDDLSGFFFVL